jgi:hypothetical protein
MACGPCQKARELRDNIKAARQKKSLNVTLPVLEARHTLCLACDQHVAGECLLLPGIDLMERASLVAGNCPLPYPRW